MLGKVIKKNMKNAEKNEIVLMRNIRKIGINLYKTSRRVRSDAFNWRLSQYDQHLLKSLAKFNRPISLISGTVIFIAKSNYRKNLI